MNEARELCLGSYGVVDTIDQLIKNCRMGHRSWKYWHAGMIHGKALAVVVAYDMYLECCEGKLNSDWCIKNLVDFHRFREKLAYQMLRCCPSKLICPGDERFRAATRIPKRKRKEREESLASSLSSALSITSAEARANGVSQQLLKDEEERGRLCGFLGPLRKHIVSVKACPDKKCKVCAVGINRHGFQVGMLGCH